MADYYPQGWESNGGRQQQKVTLQCIVLRAKRVSKSTAQQKREKVLFVTLRIPLPKFPSLLGERMKSFLQGCEQSRKYGSIPILGPAISWWVQKGTCASSLNYSKGAFMSKSVACLAKAYSLFPRPNIKWLFDRGGFVHFDRTIAAVCSNFHCFLAWNYPSLNSKSLPSTVSTE